LAVRFHADGRPIVEPMPLKPGDKAPDFTLLDQNGEPFSLSKSLKAKKVRHLIYFYPKAETG
jgi:peroxiredoxin Q/BCP